MCLDTKLLHQNQRSAAEGSDEHSEAGRLTSGFGDVGSGTGLG